MPLDRPGDQACRFPADTVHRQGYCRHACCDTATGSVTVAQPSDQARRVSADTVHRQGCCRAYCDTATGPSDTDVFEDCESPSGAAHRIPERIVGQIDDVPMPQILKEVVEVVKAVKNHPQERISGKIGEQIDDDTVPVDRPGDQVRRDPQACGVATTGPSVSYCGEGGGSPAGSVHRQNYGRASDHAVLPSDSDCGEDDESPTHAVHRQICGRACDQAVSHVTGPSDSDCGKDGGSPAHAVRRRNSLTSAEQEELRSLRQRFRDTALWSLLAQQEDAEVLEGLENIPKESIHERIVEQRQYIDKVVDAPVVQSLQEHVEVAKTFPQEHISEHTQTVNVPVP